MRMSKSRLWIAMTFLLMTTTTCHGSDCLPVTCTYVIQGLGQAPDSAVIEGWMSVPPREKENFSGTCFPTSQHLEFRSLAEQPMSFLKAFRGTDRNKAHYRHQVIHESSGGGQGGLCSSTHWHDWLKAWGQWLKWCLAWKILHRHCNFNQIWF